MNEINTHTSITQQKIVILQYHPKLLWEHYKKTSSFLSS